MYHFSSCWVRLDSVPIAALPVLAWSMSKIGPGTSGKSLAVVSVRVSTAENCVSQLVARAAARP